MVTSSRADLRSSLLSAKTPRLWPPLENSNRAIVCASHGGMSASLAVLFRRACSSERAPPFPSAPSCCSSASRDHTSMTTRHTSDAEATANTSTQERGVCPGCLPRCLLTGTVTIIFDLASMAQLRDRIDIFTDARGSYFSTNSRVLGEFQKITPIPELACLATSARLGKRGPRCRWDPPGATRARDSEVLESNNQHNTTRTMNLNSPVPGPGTHRSLTHVHIRACGAQRLRP